VREGDEPGAGSGLTREERRRDPSRVLALTDGVYAIIITLLVLDIHVPELEAHETLGSAFSDVRPSFISFTIAFIVAASWLPAARPNVSSPSRPAWALRLRDGI
jgi:hypothetical protein